MNGVMINAIPVLTRGGDDAHQPDVAEHVLGVEGGRAAHGEDTDQVEEAGRTQIGQWLVRLQGAQCFLDADPGLGPHHTFPTHPGGEPECKRADDHERHIDLGEDTLQRGLVGQ